ncbi:copper amine oxidase N-terminal domain-containing protein [Butyricicoccus faecihominis]|uniref:copper amine oxidase N-terminal domain-containing protein n=1 Tax=Butyricicoccus faecihominis TaxID=1712515 RepID=UPI00247AA276|nr:copper amine oxidase N-terminal domain-containing protein [Butyricicoccus faecihominis]MCQ5129161.1 copper amine oxidase N-terminal domain-containing protein [Butyricicoccus faecihominis]
MRTFFKILSVAFVVMICIVHSHAISSEQAEIYYQYLRVQGYPIVCLNEQGEQVPMLLYKGTNYIPIRTTGEWMGKTVSWNGKTNTISLSGSIDPTYHTKSAKKSYNYDEHFDKIDITLAPQIVVLVDGKIQNFYDANGSVVYPLISHGTTYLPLRSIGKLTGMEIAWRQTFYSTGGAQLMYLRTPLTSDQKAECESYLSGLEKRLSFFEYILYHDIQDVLRDSPEQVSVEYWKTTLPRLRQAFNAIKDYAPPTVPLLEYGYQEMCVTSQLYDSELDLATQALEQGDLNQVSNMCFASGVSLGDNVAYMQNVYYQPNTKN